MGPYRLAKEIEAGQGKQVPPNGGVNTKPFAIYNDKDQTIVGVVGGNTITISTARVGIIDILFDEIISFDGGGTTLIALWQ